MHNQTGLEMLTQDTAVKPIKVHLLQIIIEMPMSDLCTVMQLDQLMR